MRVSKNKLNPHLEKELFETLHQTIADLKNPTEVEEFLKTFLSETEHSALVKRMAVLYWLDKGRGYNNIHDNLKVSSATVATINGIINTKGAQIALQKIKAEEWANQWAEKINKFVPRGIKKFTKLR